MTSQSVIKLYTKDMTGR